MPWRHCRVLVLLLIGATFPVYGVGHDRSLFGPTCGLRRFEGRNVFKRVHGGRVSGANQWPWVVYLRVRGSRGHMTCGGSLIGPRWVLTAAHCFELSNGDEIVNDARRVTLLTGQMHAKWRFRAHTKHPVDRIVIHPLRLHTYRNHIGPFDIALVRLKYPIEEGDINNVCLPSPSDVPIIGERCIVAGWGRQIYDQGPSKVMMHVELTTISNRACAERLGMAIHPDQMCAMAFNNKASCKGDSGGPLVCLRRGHYVQTGVVSFGTPCGMYPEATPSAFADVTVFLPWITSTMNNDQLAKNTYADVLERSARSNRQYN